MGETEFLSKKLDLHAQFVCIALSFFCLALMSATKVTDYPHIILHNFYVGLFFERGPVCWDPAEGLAFFQRLNEFGALCSFALLT